MAAETSTTLDATLCAVVAADRLALSEVTYFLLSGRPPFLGETIVAVCAAHIGTQPDPRWPSTRALSLEFAGVVP